MRFYAHFIAAFRLIHRRIIDTFLVIPLGREPSLALRKLKIVIDLLSMNGNFILVLILRIFILFHIWIQWSSSQFLALRIYFDHFMCEKLFSIDLFEFVRATATFVPVFLDSPTTHPHILIRSFVRSHCLRPCSLSSCRPSGSINFPRLLPSHFPFYFYSSLRQK